MEELDIIELTSAIPSSEWREGSNEPWPAGTTGTVLELTANWALVEITDGDGCMMDMIQVPYDQAKVVAAVKAPPSPAALDDITVRAADARSRRR